ncbi:acetyltransferase [Vibrio cholerae]|nr:acetyltransferase [Vibrio cholerae]EJB5294055.1 acetyltransferase [Vibrio cholerae]EJL6880450.1 acetyltransferase [Vibrio cholerae]EJL6983974.1 acetyltransferase [Vibrio cholerae]EKF9975346.1 acetyltransferase [Vibrio cholerae]EKG0005892.1 acetyltransferase [Vibrio cholerae]
MVSVVVFEFSVMRCQPLRRALCAFLFNIPFLLIHP